MSDSPTWKRIAVGLLIVCGTLIGTLSAAVVQDRNANVRRIEKLEDVVSEMRVTNSKILAQLEAINRKLERP